MSFHRSNDGWGDHSRSKKRRFDRNRGRGYYGGRRNDYYSQNDHLTEQVQGWMQWVGSAGAPPGFMSDPSGGWGHQGYQHDPGYWSHPGGSQPYYPSYNEESEPAILTVAERLERLGEYLRRYHSNNDVQVIEKGVTASRSGLRADYSHEVIHKVGKKYIFTGCLKLNKVFIARSVGGDKQRTKQSTYRKAINIIRNKSIRHILGLRDVGIQILKIDAKSFFKKDEEYDDPGAIALKRFISIEKGEMQVDIPEGTSIDQVLKVELTDDEVKEKLAAVVSYCLETTRHPNASLMHLLDRNVFRIGLEPKCIVKFLEPDENRPAEENVICEYYLQKVLIGTGKGDTRTNAHAEAYENAYHKLTTMTGEEIFDAGKPPSEEEELKVAKTEVWAKSRTEGVESNIGRLKLLRRDPIQRNKEWNEMVIVETHDWSFNRRKNAYSILMMSAMWNGMLLEWKIEPDDKGYRCQMILQQTMVGEAVAGDQHTVRTLAAADALFKFYETQTVLKVRSTKECNDIVVSAEDIAKKGEELKAESGDTGTDDYIIVTRKRYFRDDPDDEDEDEEDIPAPPMKTARKVAPNVVKEEAEVKSSTSGDPSEDPSGDPSGVPSVDPSGVPSVDPTEEPSVSGATGSAVSSDVVEGDDANKESNGDGSKAEDGDKEDNDKGEEGGKDEEGGAEEEELPNRCRINKWHRDAIEKVMLDYKQMDTLRDLRFVYGFEQGDWDQIKYLAKRTGLKIMQKKIKDRFLKLYRKNTPDQMVEILVKLGEPSGRYELVPREGLPCHADIEDVLNLGKA